MGCFGSPAKVVGVGGGCAPIPWEAQKAEHIFLSEFSKKPPTCKEHFRRPIHHDRSAGSGKSSIM